MLPVEAASVIGSIGGIAEIAREAFRRRRLAGRIAAASGSQRSADTAADVSVRHERYSRRSRRMDLVDRRRLAAARRTQHRRASTSCGSASRRRRLGVIVFFVDIGWQMQIALWAILSVLFVLLSKSWLKRRNQVESDQPNLNRRMLNYVGRSYVLDEPIVNGQGQDQDRRHAVASDRPGHAQGRLGQGLRGPTDFVRRRAGRQDLAHAEPQADRGCGRGRSGGRRHRRQRGW